MKRPEVSLVPLLALQPAPWNPRSIKDPRFENLCRSLEADPTSSSFDWTMRESMHDVARTELEEWEREQAERLRAGRER